MASEAALCGPGACELWDRIAHEIAWGRLRSCNSDVPNCGLSRMDWGRGGLLPPRAAHGERGYSRPHRRMRALRPDRAWGWRAWLRYSNSTSTVRSAWCERGYRQPCHRLRALAPDRASRAGLAWLAVGGGGRVGRDRLIACAGESAVRMRDCGGPRRARLRMSLVSGGEIARGIDR